MLRESLYGMTRLAVRAYARLMFDLDVAHHGELPEGAKIIAPNHPSTNDPFLVALLAPGEPRVLIDETLFKVPVLGTLLHNLHQIPVVAGHGRIAYETAKWMLEMGHTVIIFPEGHVSPVEGGFCSPHTGVARLALETGAPVVPVGIHLDRERLRLVETRVGGRPELGTWYLRGPYGMTAGEPLYLHGDVSDRARVQRLTERLMQRIGRLADESALRMRRGGVSQRVVLPGVRHLARQGEV